MIGMGKVMNPFTQKVTRNLAESQFSIDILDMLLEKTKGNLTKEEETYLQRTLTELRLNYIDELKKEEKTQKEKIEEKSEKKETVITEEKKTEQSQTKNNDGEKEKKNNKLK
jgi:3-dehydroquinate dehydratase